MLVAGDAAELPAIQALMLLLPSTVYGQLFVETSVDAPAPEVSTPPRVTVFRLTRSPDDESGRLLADAVHAWLGEWMPDQLDPQRNVTLWVGASACDRVDAAGAFLERL